MAANIIQLPVQVPGMVGVLPQQKFMITGDNLATVTAAGYLNQVSLESNPVSNTDIIQMLYSYNLQTTVGTYGVFTVSINGTGVITLAQAVLTGDVVLPVVSGDIATFSGTTGRLADSGVSLLPGAALGIPLTAIVVMPTAAVLGAYATPVQIIPAAGANQAIIILSAQIVTEVVTTAFTGGGIAQLQYGATVHAGGNLATSATIATAEITAAASQIFTQTAIAPATVLATATYKGLGIFFSNATGAFTAGGTSTVTCCVQYVVIPAV